eukprot:scaffold6_cov245-Pinguiococcus_pyrenoidosus.AAC.4
MGFRAGFAFLSVLGALLGQGAAFFVTDSEWLFGNQLAYEDGVLVELEGNSRFRQDSPTYGDDDFDTLIDNLNNHILPKGVSIDNTSHPFRDELLAGAKSLTFDEPSEVRITFVKEGGSFQNALGYISWDPSDITIPVPEVSPDDFHDWVDANQVRRSSAPGGGSSGNRSRY